MAKYDTDELIASVKRRGFIPAAQATFSVDDFLKAASEEQEESLEPLLLSARSEYWVTQQDQAIVGGQANYPVPARAIGNKLRDVSFIMPDGSYRKLPQVQLEEIPDLGGVVTSGTPQCFYMLDTDVVVFPTPSTSYGSLRMSYYLKPSRLVATTATATITAISPDRLSLTTSPQTGLTGAAGTLLDLVSGTSPFKRVATDQAVSAPIASTSIALASPAPATLKVGDIAALSGETSFPNLPSELHPLLARLGAANLVTSLGDFDMGDRLYARAEAVKKQILPTISTRVDGRAKKIVNRVWL